MRTALIRWGLRLVGLGVLVYVAVVLTVLGFIQLYIPPDLPRGATIVVLGAGQKADGSVGASSRLRVEAAVRLYQADPGARLLMTGGKLGDEIRPVGAAMAEAAEALGVPGATILVEGVALSTLQNGLFTADLLAVEEPVVLVTQRFHLPRSWASFRWAGFREITLYPADTPEQHWQRSGWSQVLMEGVKAPLNMLRALAASGLGLIGVSEGRYIRMLD